MQNTRRDRRRTCRVETLEIRQMLAADYLYSLTARPGAPEGGFGLSHAASDEYHVVGNPFVERLPENGFLGEVQVHDADTGALLRTIANPDPDDLYRFGYSVDVFADLIVVGAVGWGDLNTGDTTPGSGFSDRSGRAYLFDASTGDLLFRFDGTFMTGQSETEDHDLFGESVSIDGNFVVVGAPGLGPFAPDNAAPPDTDVGHAYIFSAVTGTLLHVLENPEPDVDFVNMSPDFGVSVSTSDGKVVVGNPDTEEYTSSDGTNTWGKAYVYEASTGVLLHTLLGPDLPGLGEDSIGHRVIIDGNVIAVGVDDPGSLFAYIFDTTTGNLTQTLDLDNGLLSDLSGNQVATRVAQFSTPTSLGSVLDAGLGTITSSIIPPPGYDPHTTPYISTVTVFGNRLLVGEAPLTSSNSREVLVYDLGGNAPPTDIILSANTVAENAATNTLIGILTATDPDPGDSRTFSLVSSADGRFKLSGSELRVDLGQFLNFEADTSHSVTVRVTDSVGNTYDKAFTINVTDLNEAATLISLSPASESENTTNGAVVGSLFSNDPDASDPETFELLDGAGGRFEQVGLQIRVADASLLDFETASSHQINVRVTDSAGHVLEQLVTISITDFNYAPTDILLNGSTVAESALNVHFSPSQQPGLGFGNDIATSGDRYIISVPANTVAGFTGAAIVYNRTTGLVVTQLTNPAGLTNDLFAFNVALDGNIAVVSAAQAAGGGVVYVFDVTTGGLLRTLTSPLSGSTGFGVSVGVSGDLIAVGSNMGNGSRVDLFDADDGSLIETLMSPNPAGGSTFGFSLAISGNSIVVGQSFAQVGGVSVGAAYVYQYDPGTGNVTLVTTLNNPSPNDSDRFGQALALTGNSVVVGADGDDTQADSSGLVYVFDATTGTLLRTISNPTPASGDLFGRHVAASGNRILVSANNSTFAQNAGAAYLFDLTTGTLLATLHNPVPDADDFFVEVAMLGETILVGTPGDDSVGTNAGVVYRYDLPVAATIGQLSGVDPEAMETFTWSLQDDAGGRFAVNGNILVVADPTLFDFESASAHQVIVRATDSGGIQFLKSFTIQVTDVAENLHMIVGTSGDDAYVLSYSSTVAATGTVTVTVSTNGGPVTTVGTYPMQRPLILDGRSGTDSVRVVGTTGSDSVAVLTNVWLVNGASLLMTSIETRIIDGGAGNDTYRFDADGPLGLITLDEAGGGVDLINFETLTTADVAVNLSLTASQVVHPANLSLILQPANAFENIYGGSGNDVLTGNTLANTILGGPGNDTINGGGGNDSLSGDAGDDTFVFDAVTSAESDSIAEYLNGGTDTLDFSALSINVTMILNTNGIQSAHTNRTLQLNQFDTFENLIGGTGNDTLTGNSLANTLTGNAGEDVLRGLAGSDILIGGMNNDTYVFANAAAPEADSIIELDNQGADILAFTFVTAGVTLDLSSTAVQPVHVNRTVQLSSSSAFETVFCNAGNFDDVLIGNAGTNYFASGGGNDTLNGGGGSDFLDGGSGNDTYIFGPASASEIDSVTENAGGGTDTLDFSAVTEGILVRLWSDAVQNVHVDRTLQLTSGFEVENVTGGSGNDTLIGSNKNNTLIGNGGHDNLIGHGGNDTMLGGLGDDRYLFYLAVGLEADTVTEFANEGTDTLDFSGMMTGVFVRLWDTSVQNVHTGRTLQLNNGWDVENVSGGSGNDTLIGSNNSNILIGNGGNDNIIGHGGNDTVTGGTGDDWYGFYEAVGNEIDTLAEQLNEGSDTLDFSGITTDVYARLWLTSVQNVHTGRSLQLNNGLAFENLTGGSGNDTLIGTNLNNTLIGNGGNDNLIGHNGDDILLGLDGDDSLDGGAGRDLLIGGLGLDSILGGSDDDILIAGDTTFNTNVPWLNDIRTAWTSVVIYTTRVANIRSGVGASNASLQATVNVLNDAGEDDVLTGNAGEDWYLKALDDVITDLLGGELIDVL